MLVEKEKIIKAKEKLGVQNAEIIREILQIEDYDTRNMKGICPFHSENTPSFIFNPKNYSFHCFGCGKNVDIIDAYMHIGKTYLEAVQELFRLAKIRYSFGEMGVPTTHPYRYPKPEYADNKDEVYRYLNTRKISKETADYLNIAQDKQGNLLFQYFDLNDVLMMVKVRPSHKVKKGDPKTFCLPGFDTTPLLFNENKINISEPLLITSGELDCAAAVESGFHNACSIPLGDQNTHWVTECWDFLEQFDEIIVAYDNDDSGKKFIKDIVPRLGSWRCKVVDIPEIIEVNDRKIFVKDLNEYLFYMGKEKTLDLILNATDTPVPSVLDFSDIEEEDLDEIDGIDFGIDELDRELMKIFYGSLCVLSGTPGSGKTSFLYQLICNALDQEKNVWLFSRELPARMSKSWLLYLMAGTRNVNQYRDKKGAIYYKVKPSARKQINDYYQKSLHIYRDDYPNDVQSLQSSMIDSARKYGCKLFIVDNMTTIDLKANDSNKYEKQTDFINWLIYFSMKYHVATILVIHPKKMNPEYGSNVGIYDLSGTSNIVNLAHRTLALKRIKEKEKQGVPLYNGNGWKVPPCKYDVVISVIKDRLRGRQNLECGLYYDKASRRFFSSYDEYDRQYKWDQSVYTDRLEYPIKSEDEEVFGIIKGDGKCIGIMRENV